MPRCASIGFRGLLSWETRMRRQSLLAWPLSIPVGSWRLSNKKGFLEAQKSLLAEDTRFELVRA